MGIITKGIACIDPTRIFDRVRLKLASTCLLCAASILAAGIAYPAEIKKLPPQTCEPKSGEVAVRSASGRCAVRGPGIYRTTSAIGLGDEPIVMINLGSFAYATVCGVNESFGFRCLGPLSPGVTKLPTDTLDARWTFLQVARSCSDLECQPKDTEVIISGTSNAIGPCIRLGPGTYRTPEELGLADSSFVGSSQRVHQLRQEGTLLPKLHTHYMRIGRGVLAKMCMKDNFSDPCENTWQFQATTRELRGLRSMKVWNVCALRENQVALFGEPNEIGPCTILKVGEYLTAESLKIEGGAIRSIWVDKLVEARTCSDENMKGECVDIKESTNVTWTIRSLTVRSR